MRRSGVAKCGTGSIVPVIAGLALLGMLVVPQAGADDFLGLPETSVNSLLNPEELISKDAFGDTLIEVRIVSSVMPIPAGSPLGEGGETAKIIFTFGNTVAPGTFKAVLDSALPGKDKRELDFEFLPTSEAMPFGGVRVFVDVINSGRNLMVATVFGNKTGSQGRARDQDRITLLCCVGNDEQGPVANAGPDQFVITGDTVSLNGGGSFDPNPGDFLTYEWDQLSGLPVTLSDPGSRMPTFTSPQVPIGQTAVLEFELSVSDGIWTSLPDRVRVSVLGENQAPTCVASASPTVVDEGATVTLDGSASSDPEGSPVDCAWSQDAGTPVLDPTSDSCIVTFDAPLVSADEDLTFTLTVTDTLGASCTASATVTVKRPNVAPVANAGADQTVFEGEVVVLNGTGSSDPDNGPQPLSFSWQQIAGCLVNLFEADTPTASFTAPFLIVCGLQTQVVPGPVVLTFELTVSDGAATGTDTVDVTVTASTGTTGLTATALSVERVRPTR
ncbi:MAG: hypothetical protein V3U98_04310 [Acidobacteriota bacterium]